MEILEIGPFFKWLVIFGFMFLWIFDARWFRLLTGQSDTVYDAWKSDFVCGHHMYYATDEAFNVVSNRLGQLFKRKKLRKLDDTDVNMDDVQWAGHLIVAATDAYGAMPGGQHYIDYIAKTLDLDGELVAAAVAASGQRAGRRGGGGGRRRSSSRTSTRSMSGSLSQESSPSTMSESVFLGNPPQERDEGPAGNVVAPLPSERLVGPLQRPPKAPKLSEAQKQKQSEQIRKEIKQLQDQQLQQMRGQVISSQQTPKILIKIDDTAQSYSNDLDEQYMDVKDKNYSIGGLLYDFLKYQQDEYGIMIPMKEVVLTLDPKKGPGSYLSNIKKVYELIGKNLWLVKPKKASVEPKDDTEKKGYGTFSSIFGSESTPETESEE